MFALSRKCLEISAGAFSVLEFENAETKEILDPKDTVYTVQHPGKHLFYYGNEFSSTVV